MSEIFISIALVCLVFSALWALARRARRGCYPEPVSSHTPVPSMDVAAERYAVTGTTTATMKEGELEKVIGTRTVVRGQAVSISINGIPLGTGTLYRPAGPESGGAVKGWIFEPDNTTTTQSRLDASLKQALRSMSDESLRAFSPEAGDTQAKRMRKLEMDRRSRKARRHARAARKAFESIQNGCKDSILSKAERDSLMPQGWDANGSPT